ncbi:MAG: LEPR-XLL domain-containing protein [Thermoguttaceae bacterium]
MFFVSFVVGAASRLQRWFARGRGGNKGQFASAARGRGGRRPLVCSAALRLEALEPRLLLAGDLYVTRLTPPRPHGQSLQPLGHPVQQAGRGLQRARKTLFASVADWSSE